MSHPSGYGMGMFYAVLSYGKFKSLFEKGIGVVWTKVVFPTAQPSPSPFSNRL